MRTISLVLVLPVATATGVFAVSGSATLTGRSTLAARHCGRGRGSFTVRYRITGTAAGNPGHATFQVHASGPWTPG